MQLAIVWTPDGWLYRKIDVEDVDDVEVEIVFDDEGPAMIVDRRSALERRLDDVALTAMLDAQGPVSR